jgi:ribosomal protein S12 methylthiotransferase
MLTQQDVVFKRLKSQRGQTVDLLVDRPAGRDLEDGYVARSTAQAPEIDSVTLLHSPTELHPGQLLTARITGSDGYDLTAEPLRSKSRGLTVIK